MPTLDVITAKKLAERLKVIYGKKLKLDRNIYGPTPPSVFVGSRNYPNLSVGSLVSPEGLNLPDDPRLWLEEEISPQEIVSFRLGLINAYTRFNVNIARKKNRILEEISEGAKSIRSVDVDVIFKKSVRFNPIFGKNLPIVGLSGIVKKYRIESNPKVPRIVDALVEESVSSELAVVELYRRGFSEYYIDRLFSLGMFGYYSNRKLVPTRWSITAVHTIISKNIIKKLKNKPSINENRLFFWGAYGNYFIIALFPSEKFEIEYFEVFLPDSAYNSGKVPIYGRDDESGGFFATRLSILEYLEKLKRNASSLIIRFVTPEYKVPLGVWVVREVTKKVFRYEILKSPDITEILDKIKQISERKYNFNVNKILNKSIVLKKLIFQKKLKEFVMGKH